MNHYIATSPVLFQDAVLYFIGATFRLRATSGKLSPSYLVPVFVYTPGRLSHKVSLSVTASCVDT